MRRTFKEFQSQWEDAANSVGGGGVSMPATWTSTISLSYQW